MQNPRRLKLLAAYLLASIVLAVLGNGFVAESLFLITTCLGLQDWHLAVDKREKRELRNLILSFLVVPVLYVYPLVIALETVAPRHGARYVGLEVAYGFDVRSGYFVCNHKQSVPSSVNFIWPRAAV